MHHKHVFRYCCTEIDHRSISITAFNNTMRSFELCIYRYRTELDCRLIIGVSSKSIVVWLLVSYGNRLSFKTLHYYQMPGICSSVQYRNWLSFSIPMSLLIIVALLYIRIGLCDRARRLAGLARRGSSRTLSGRTARRPGGTRTKVPTGSKSAYVYSIQVPNNLVLCSSKKWRI